MTVDVYWNFNKKCWSIRDSKTRKVIGHKKILMLSGDSVGMVSRAGNARVRREKRKNVHAFIRGKEISPMGMKEPKSFYQIKYNPYSSTDFHPIGDWEHVSFDRNAFYNITEFPRVKGIVFDLFGDVWALK